MNEKELIFLSTVRDMCSDNPEMLHHMINAALGGITEQAKLERERACDFEIVASVMFGLATQKKRVSANLKEYYETLAFDKIKKWENHNSLNWKATEAYLNET